jgi:hypothetical protein
MPNACGVDMNESIQLRIQPVDFREVSLDEFDRRNVSFADAFRHGDRRKKGQIAH